MVDFIQSYSRSRLILLSIIFGYLIVSYLLPIAFPDRIGPYLKEDGLVENAGAFFFLAASILIIMTYYKFMKKKPTEYMWESFWLIGLSTLFFVAFGEEISWGQRILNFDTPDTLKEINQQKEFNIHNLEMFHGIDENGERKTGIAAWLTGHRMFYVVLFGYFVIVPVLMLFKNFLSGLILKLKIPVVPIWISITFLAVILLAKIIQFMFAENDSKTYHLVVEVMETNIALVALIFGLVFYQNPEGEKNLGMVH